MSTISVREVFEQQLCERWDIMVIDTRSGRRITEITQHPYHQYTLRYSHVDLTTVDSDHQVRVFEEYESREQELSEADSMQATLLRDNEIMWKLLHMAEQCVDGKITSRVWLERWHAFLHGGKDPDDL